jgi:TraB/PrgY/gumN family
MVLYRRSYKIHKDGLLKGYLLGSLHMHMNPLDFDKLQKKISIIVESVDEIFFECNLPHHSSLPYGVERAVLANTEAFGKSSQLRYFETLVFQQAMLNSSVWFGRRIVQMPWLKYDLLQKHPLFWFWISKATLLFVKIYNVFYNIFSVNSHTLAVQKFAKEQHQLLLQIVQAYEDGNALELSQEDAARVLLESRNQQEAALIKQNIENTPRKEQLALYVIGVAHFPGKTGLVELLQNAGYVLEPYDF